MKFISAWLSLEQRWNGSAIEKHICPNISPHLRKPKRENDRPAILYALRNRLNQPAALHSLFEAYEF
jgi:hypothetical protein